MSHDIVIRNGLIVDGRGGEPTGGDVAIDGDLVTEVGKIDGKGKREINADGRLVTPGFVDIHTHLDAQIAWDPIGTSSCWHGITSVVLGNCGVTFAPCKPEDRQYLAEMMESVEDIPADSIMRGLDWTWTTYGEYLDALEKMPKGLNTGGMVGHCAVRYHVMGERSLEKDPATDSDIDAMCDLVDEAIGAGALGFSTSRTMLHRVPDGRPVPGTYTDDRELLAIGDVLGRQGKGVFESAPAFGNPERTQHEVEMMGEICRRSGRPTTFGLTQVLMAPTLHSDVLAAVEKEQANGASMWPQTTARGIGMIYGLVHRTPFDRSPAWQELQGLDLQARLGVLRDPDRRARLIADAEAAPPPLPLDTVFVMPDGDARYDNLPEQSLAAHAKRMGVSPAEAFIKMTLERQGKLLMYWAFLNSDLNTVEDMLRSPVTVIGLAKTAAHVGQIMDSSQPTFFLTHWVRDNGLFGVGEAIRKLTSEPAQLFGMKGRGTLEPGVFADVNVIDLDGMRLPQPEYVHDFPGGAGRFVQRASGYGYSLVNGEVFMEDGQHAGAFAGRVLRSERD